jgi:hypothetical protein
MCVLLAHIAVCVCVPARKMPHVHQHVQALARDILALQHRLQQQVSLLPVFYLYFSIFRALLAYALLYFPHTLLSSLNSRCCNSAAILSRCCSSAEISAPLQQFCRAVADSAEISALLQQR